MSGKHYNKYLQNYYLFFSLAIALLLLFACNTTKKVPKGEYLLTKNIFKYEDGKLFSDEIPDYILQKPNKKMANLFPFGLWMYNNSNKKYDSILTEYMTYPNELRNQKLRDSLFVKFGHPEYKGRNLFWNRWYRNWGQAPVILEQGKTDKSAENIRKFLVYRGYWDAKVQSKNSLDSTAQKAASEYLIAHKDPTYIKDYYHNIPDKSIKAIYEEDLKKSVIKKGDILNQKKLEEEITRINNKMRERGYYKFNASNEEIYFNADSLQSRKQVPVTLEIHKNDDSGRFKVSTIKNIKVFYTNKLSDTLNLKKDSLRGINFYKIDNQYKTRALWLPIISKTGEVYNQQNLDLTKRNLQAMNNFSITSKIIQRDSLLNINYYLTPLSRYELKLGADLNYSQILNFAASPSVNLTSRNIFGNAENLTFGVGGTFGRIKNSDGNRDLAYEISGQAGLNFPRLLLPFRYYKLIPKRYSPTSSINLGASLQENIGLGRINVTAGLSYFANVNDIVSHKLSIFNTQLSFTQNKSKYYDFFPGDKAILENMFSIYSQYNPSYNMNQDTDTILSDIASDINFINKLDSTTEGKNLTSVFIQSLINKDRQTQDVLISSLIYNFIYNEIGNKYYTNPFYFNAKFEVAGNVFNLFKNKIEQNGVISDAQHEIFKIPYSQFVKFDFDIRKYFTFGKNTLAMRQLIGIGIPYGNSSDMPFVRSYFNGGSNDIRAWRVYGGLGPADSQLDSRIRSYAMDNVKLTTNIEYRIPFSKMYEGAIFTDAGNIWSLKDSGFDDQFKFEKFIKQMGVGSGLGLRINIAYINLRLDAAYKIYDPNLPEGDRWRISKIQPFKPVLNFAFGYPF